MLDCLPAPEDWSAESQYAMLQEHLQALHFHLEALERAQAAGVLALLAAAPHFSEINTRCLEAHDLAQQLARQPESVLAAMGGPAC